MEKAKNSAQEVHTLWINQNEHIVSFHEVEGDDYEQWYSQIRTKKWNLCSGCVPAAFVSNKSHSIKSQGDLYEICH